jgi:hypothetical protein
VEHNTYEEWTNLHWGSESKEYEMDDTRKAFRIFGERTRTPLGRIRRQWQENLTKIQNE